MMRRGVRYTSRPEGGIQPSQQTDIHDSFASQPFFTRLLLRLTALLTGQNMDESVRTHLVTAYGRRLERRRAEFYRVSDRTVGVAFLRQLETLDAEVTRARAELKPLLHSAAFYQYLRETAHLLLPGLQPVVEQALAAVPQIDHTTEDPLADVIDRTVQVVRAQLDALVPTMTEVMQPYWNLMAVMAMVLELPTRRMVATARHATNDGRIPVQALLSDLVTLHAFFFHVREVWRAPQSDALEHFLETRWRPDQPCALRSVRQRLPSIGASLELETLIRIGVSDPGAAIAWTVQDAAGAEQTIDALLEPVAEGVRTRVWHELQARSRELTGHYGADAHGSSLVLSSGLPEEALRLTVCLFSAERFQHTIRALYHLVIDGRFADSDHQRVLHSRLSTLDTSWLVLRPLFLETDGQPGEFQQTMARIERAAVAALARGQQKRTYVTTLSARVIPSLREIGEGLDIVGGILNGLLGSDGTVRGVTFSDGPVGKGAGQELVSDLVTVAARTWHDLGVILTTMVKLETSVHHVPVHDPVTA